MVEIEHAPMFNPENVTEDQYLLTPCLPVSSADNVGKQFGPRSGPTNRRAWSGSKLFDILIVFLKEFFQKV